MEHFGWHVSRLIRIAYGPFQLGALKKGEVDEVRSKVLKEQLGTQNRFGFAEKDKKRLNRPSIFEPEKSNFKKHNKSSKTESANTQKANGFHRQTNTVAYKKESDRSANYKWKK